MKTQIKHENLLFITFIKYRAKLEIKFKKLKIKTSCKLNFTRGKN